MSVVRRRLGVGTVLLWTSGEEKENSDKAVSSLFQGKTAVGGAPAAYVCRGATCLAPVTDPEALKKLLDG